MDLNAPANPRNRSKTRVFPRGFDSSSASSSNSSSSSSLRYSPSDRSSRPPLSPLTPLRLPSGVPFSWEKLPGIPKRQASGRRNDSAASLKLTKRLPLPPAVAPRKQGNPPEGSFRKKSSPEWDPFIAALVECSKDDGHKHGRHGNREGASGRSLWIGTRVSRSISGHIGFIGLYASCKCSSAADESIIYVPRPNRTPAALYGLIKYHHHGSVDK